MGKIPVGAFFEAVIDWLKENLGFIFEWVDTVLGFVIGALETVLLLDHEAIYPSVAVVLAVGAIGYLLFSKRSRTLRWVGGAVALIGMGGLEMWRYQTLEAEMTVGEAAELGAELTDYRDALQAVAPEDYGWLRELIAEAEALAPEENRFVRNLGRVERRMERLRDGSFADAADLARDVEEVFEDDRVEVALPETLRTKIATTEQMYFALSGIEQSERLANQLERQEEPKNRYRVLNSRTYERMLAHLDASLANAERLGISEATVADWLALRERIAALDPERLELYPAIVWIILFTAWAFLTAGAGLAVFSLAGFALVLSMGYWVATMETLALVAAATVFALLIGVPAGIWTGRNALANRAIRPVLDFMQTMPAFVYLIPAVLFFGLGRVPGAIATLIFAMPPAVRLTALGIRQVPQEVVEAAQAFGATPRQLLFKAQLPIALPTILAGLNQTIMLALSMVVIGGMIGAGGLGAQVLIGITQMKIAVGFESGVAVVVLAIYLDRITQHLGGQSRK